MNLNFAVMSFFPVMWKSKKKDLIFNIKWCIYHVAISSDIERASYPKKKQVIENTWDSPHQCILSFMLSALRIKNFSLLMQNLICSAILHG